VSTLGVYYVKSLGGAGGDPLAVLKKAPTKPAIHRIAFATLLIILRESLLDL